MKLSFTHIKNSILSIKKDKRKDVFNWGLDNLYPQLVEGLINQSVTSKLCVDKVAKAIYGKSFGDAGDIIVNRDGETLNEVLRLTARDYAKYNNVFLHIGYNGELEIKSIKLIPVTNVRTFKDDDTGYSGKYVVYNNWDKSKGKIDEKGFKMYDRFNPIKKVIESQIEKAGNITKYKGQILHIQKESSTVYSLPDLNPVLSEALLEKNSATFRSRGAEKGFLNTKLMVVQPFSSDDERYDFKQALDDLQGPQNAGNVLLLEASNVSDDLDSQVKLEDLSSKYNDKLFEYSDVQARKNISLAFGVPLGLVDVSEASLFGNSGELLKQMKQMLWESKEEERDMLESAFNKLMKNYSEQITAPLEIVSPFKDDTTEGETQEPQIING